MTDHPYAARQYYYGTVADSYTEVRTKTPQARAKWDAEIRGVRNLLASYPPSGFVLDIPCGNARLAGVFRELSVQWIGLDISSDMLLKARQRSVGLLRGDAECLPLCDAAVDCAVCLRFANLVPRDVLYCFMTELRRTVRRFVLLEARIRREGRVARIMRTARRVKGKGAELGGGRDRAQDTEREKKRDPIRVLSERDFLSLLWDAGWKERMRLELNPLPFALRPDPLMLFVVAGRSDDI